jgi:hypothetical protein
MPQDIKVLFMLLIVVLIIVFLMQNNSKSTTSEEILKRNESFAINNTVDDEYSEDLAPRTIPKNLFTKGKIRKVMFDDVSPRRSLQESINTEERGENYYINSKKNNIINNILREKKADMEQELDSLISNDSSFENPIDENINMLRDDTSSSKVDNSALEELIREVNTGNDLRVDSTQNKIFQDRSRSINSAKNYRKVSYADSEYRYDFNGNENNSDFSELANFTNEANNILDSKKTNNSTFNGFPDGNVNFTKNDNNMSVRGYLNQNELYGDANLKEFTNQKPESQQQKVLNLYNSDAYLPNDRFSDPKLTKGFQILENPVSVNNPNLIPVLKSIPVSSVMGSNRNSTYDIRSEPPNPKTVVSPFLNSSIQPDIYATNRGCL